VDDPRIKPRPADLRYSFPEAGKLLFGIGHILRDGRVRRREMGRRAPQGQVLFPGDTGGQIRGFFRSTTQATHAGINLELNLQGFSRLFGGPGGFPDKIPVTNQGDKPQRDHLGEFLRQGKGEEEDGGANPRFPEFRALLHGGYRQPGGPGVKGGCGDPNRSMPVSVSLYGNADPRFGTYFFPYPPKVPAKPV
jgi:hypothetical protein